jgi:hypothetical protein
VGALAATGAAGSLAHAGTAGTGSTPVALPKPIPGGTDLSGFGLPPPYDGVIHIFTPGTPGVVLPFSGIPLEGLGVEPAVIADFSGATALAYLAGEAEGSDGQTYGVEIDLRVSEGDYVAEDGSLNRGLFALI